jgi:hypothetical protein
VPALGRLAHHTQCALQQQQQQRGTHRTTLMGIDVVMMVFTILLSSPDEFISISARCEGAGAVVGGRRCVRRAQVVDR